jgi:hypothetical protein
MLKKLFLFFFRSLASTLLDVGLTIVIVGMALQGGVYGAFAGILVALIFSFLRQFVDLPNEIELANSEKQEAEPGIA